MGRAVLERLHLRGDETVLDAGCGSGRVTEALLERLPNGKVIALDSSESMIEAARKRLGGRAELRRLDLLELEPEMRLDAVFSTATFHWIGDHERLFARLHAALSRGGQLVAQCGGEGNITRLRAQAATVLERPPYAPYFADWQAPWNYAGAEQTAQRLSASGFRQVDCWLAPAPVQPEQPREFLSTVVLGPHVQHLPPELREPFMDGVMATLGEPITVDYVRLNIDATA
jgi:trans-aconitate 2-methyltransferase